MKKKMKASFENDIKRTFRFYVLLNKSLMLEEIEKEDLYPFHLVLSFQIMTSSSIIRWKIIIEDKRDQDY